MKPSPQALGGLLVAATMLAGSLSQPFLTSAFEPEFPPNVRRALAVYDGVAGKWDKAKGWLNDTVGGQAWAGEDRRPAEQELRDWIVAKAKIPEGDQYLVGIIEGLFEQGDGALALAILVFSVLFPIAKLVVAGVVGWGDRVLGDKRRATAVYWLLLLGKWSMADVFIAALIVVFFKAEGFHYTFEPKVGLYLFASAAVLSSLVVGMVAKRELAAHIASIEAGVEMVEIESREHLMAQISLLRRSMHV